MEGEFLASSLLTIAGTVFVAELTDKDALFLLALATRNRASTVFAAGSAAFTISTTVIVLLGSLLLGFVPVIAVKLAGGSIMLVYAAWEFFRFYREKESVDEREERLMERSGGGFWAVFGPAVVTLVALDLAGDATELLTVVFLAKFEDAFLVFVGAVAGLVAAVAVETALGNRLGRLLPPGRLRAISVTVFVAIGLTVIVTTVFGA